MKITLYINKSEYEKINKVLEFQGEMSGTLRTPTSVLRPVIDIQFDDLIVTTQRQLSYNGNDVVYNTSDEISYNFNIDYSIINYVYIHEFKRYYFITDKVFTSNKILTLSLNNDPLMSFKNGAWYNKPLFVGRRTNGDISIADNMQQYKFQKFIEKNGDKVQIYGLEYYFDIQNQNETYYDNKRRIVVTASRTGDLLGIYGNSNMGYNQTTFTPYGMPVNTRGASFSGAIDVFYVLTFKQFNEILLPYLNNHENAVSSIKSIMVMPFNIDCKISVYPSYIYFDNCLISSIDTTTYGYIYELTYVNHGLYRFFRIKFNSELNRDFKEFEPYTTAKLYIPYCEFIELNLHSVYDCELSISYQIDFETGTSTYVLLNETRQIIESTGSCQFGAPLNVSPTNNDSLKRQRENNILNLTLGSVGGLIGSMSKGDLMSFQGGMFNNMTKYLTRENSFVPVTNARVNNSNVGSMLYLNPFVIWTKSVPTFSNDDFNLYKQNVGLPYNKYISIADCDDGEHIVVLDASDISMAEGMTSSEFEYLKGALEKGVYK